MVAIHPITVRIRIPLMGRWLIPILPVYGSGWGNTCVKAAFLGP